MYLSASSNKPNFQEILTLFPSAHLSGSYRITLVIVSTIFSNEGKKWSQSDEKSGIWPSNVPVTSWRICKTVQTRLSPFSTKSLQNKIRFQTHYMPFLSSTSMYTHASYFVLILHTVDICNDHIPIHWNIFVLCKTISWCIFF